MSPYEKLEFCRAILTYPRARPYFHKENTNLYISPVIGGVRQIIRFVLNHWINEKPWIFQLWKTPIKNFTMIILTNVVNLWKSPFSNLCFVKNSHQFTHGFSAPPRSSVDPSALHDRWPAVRRRWTVLSSLHSWDAPGSWAGAEFFKRSVP